MSSSPTVRPAGTQDADAFAACHLACWKEAYSDLWGADRFEGIDPERMARQRRKEIASGEARHYLAELDGEVIGIAIAGPSRDEHPLAEQELYAIYVRSAHQGSGVAGTLLAASLDGNPASLWVYRDNPRASAFYVHNGFIPDGEERTDSVGILEIRMIRR